MTHTTKACLTPSLLTLLLFGSAGIAVPNAAVQERPAPPVTFTPVTVTGRDGTSVAAEQGVMRVPENRSRAGGRIIELHFLRFKATGQQPGSPIVFLAGGPGGSGIATARGQLPLFTAMREFGDVIALDQRGSGLSNSTPECMSNRRIPVNAPFDFGVFVAESEAAATECATFWRQQGVDVAAYNAVESAHDLDDLRRALGADKITLWGISYGSRLGLTALRELPGRIDRAILASVEPPHVTIKLPASLDAQLVRLQAIIDADPAAAKTYPDIAALMRRVARTLDQRPLPVELPDGKGGAVSFSLSGSELRMLAGGGLGDPGNAAQFIPFVAAIDAGRMPTAPLLSMVLRMRQGLDPMRLDVMAAMDYTAGISPARLAVVEQQAATSILGDHQSYEQRVLKALGLTDLGEAYRAPVHSDVLTLVLTGTLDGRHDARDEDEALRGLTRLTRVTVVNGGHNLLGQSPAITNVMQEFMRGRRVPSSVLLPPPVFPQ